METNNDSVWNIERLLSLISNKIEENFRLDCKAAKGLKGDEKGKAEITKDVSAFANSDGGIILYGISEYSDEALKHVPEKIDPVSRKAFSKEWIEHVISNIRPAIQNLRIYPIQISTNIDEVVYIVEISKSTTAHQASDGRYYKRYNFESKSMLDYEIRDIMNRLKHAIISANRARESALRSAI